MRDPNMWRIRRPHTPDPALQDTAKRLTDLQARAERVHQALRTRADRNHWSETVHELWQGKPA